MKKSFTPQSNPDFLSHLTGKSPKVAKPSKATIDNIMAYVNSTQEMQTKQMGAQKLFLN
ncbi:MAG: hypothetical protein PF489_09205 [Salinivirgaceae bacterium]|jgi:hypothetical protein|nr:hypothetical protein [Salinivirgaceae bacterium]